MVSPFSRVGVLLDEVRNGSTIVGGDGTEELSHGPDVGLLGPFAFVDGAEAAGHALTAGVLLHETAELVNNGAKSDLTLHSRYAASEELLTFLLERLFLLVRLSLRTMLDSMRYC